jgi:hypothetical protein
MKLISVNVGLPRDIIWRGKAVKSSIWKNPVEGRVHVSTLNLDGDQPTCCCVPGRCLGGSRPRAPSHPLFSGPQPSGGSCV